MANITSVLFLIFLLVATALSQANANNDNDDDCYETWPGDGWCDSECNTAKHVFDGGDCCEDTCIDAEYECGLNNGYDCKRKEEEEESGNYKVVKEYKGFTLELQCVKNGNGYATRYSYELGTDSHNYKRRKNFHSDAKLKRECQQKKVSSYKHPYCTGGRDRRKNPFCYDRGHVVMAEHMDNDAITMYESNTMTNILPQASGFNQDGGAWKFTEDLIECTRDMVSIQKQVIFGGFLYTDDSNDYFMESHGIPTPDTYWKVVVRYFKSSSGEDNNKPDADVIAWVFPNVHDASDDKLNIRRSDGGYLISIADLQHVVSREEQLLELPETFTETAFDSGRTWVKPPCRSEAASKPTPVPDVDDLSSGDEL